MRAAHYDLFVETGVDFYRVAQLWAPTGAPITASSVVIGQRIYVDGAPMRVAEMTTSRGNDGTLWVDLIFGLGLWSDPHVRVMADEKMMPAAMVDVTSAAAAFNLNGQRREIPTAIDEKSIVFMMDSGMTGALAGNVGAWSWDLYGVTPGMGRLRLLEGTLTVQRGETP